MICVKEAKKILSKHLKRGEIQEVPLQESLGYFLAEEITSPIAVPSFDNSSKDGYALAFDPERIMYSITTTVQAGNSSFHELAAGETARIFTGAKMPKGADTVVMQEFVQIDESKKEIRFGSKKHQPGENVRYQGSQCEKGTCIIEKESEITAGTIGLLASVGVAKVKVFTPPKIQCIITGNELKSVGELLEPGEIYDANSPMIKAFLQQNKIISSSFVKVLDDKESHQKAINRALEENNVVLISGGISVGDYDFVEECLTAAGVQKLFYKVKQRPGKPFYVGKKDEKWVFALPGNPGAVFSCLQQYVKPCLQYIMGKNKVWQPSTKLPLPIIQKKVAGLSFFVKAKRTNSHLEILQGQQSFNLQAFNEANCLVELEESFNEVPKGTLVNVYDF